MGLLNSSYSIVRHNSFQEVVKFINLRELFAIEVGFADDKIVYPTETQIQEAFISSLANHVPNYDEVKVEGIKKPVADAIKTQLKRNKYQI